MKLNLVVYYAEDIEKTKCFYEKLGLAFQKEKHDSGPQHYSCSISDTLFEIYPAGGSQKSSILRLGFDFASNDSVSDDTKNYIKRHAINPSLLEDETHSATLIDPNGNKVDLVW